VEFENDLERVKDTVQGKEKGRLKTP